MIEILKCITCCVYLKSELGANIFRFLHEIAQKIRIFMRAYNAS